MKRLNGIHLSHRKNTEDHMIEDLPAPQLVRIPMQMHIGAPCTPTCKKGDTVKVGQVIGDSDAFVSAPIHASVSGTVKEVSAYLTSSGVNVQSVVIESDGALEVAESCVPPKIENREDFIAAVRASGLVGLGGAGFPTHVKLRAKKPIEMLIVNGAECEPYLTADCRRMLEDGEAIVDGIRLVMRWLDIKEARIGIENNKPAAIKHLTELCADSPEIKIVALPPVYPQGAEKVLIYHCSGKVVPEGRLPGDIGVLVLNVSSCAFLSAYVKTGIPLIDRVITVDGDAVGKPCNLRARIGTPASALLEYAGWDKEKTKELICGGPMMGLDLYSELNPVLKQQNGLLALSAVKKPKTSACIRCGRCRDACPMNLLPMELERAYLRKDGETLAALHLGLCMNCGCCSYVCPARRPLAESNQLAKALLPRK